MLLLAWVAFGHLWWARNCWYYRGYAPELFNPAELLAGMFLCWFLGPMTWGIEMLLRRYAP